MKNLLRVLGLGVLLLTGCKKYKIEENIKQETAVVSYKKTPSHLSYIDVDLALTNKDGGFGVGINGIGFGIGGYNFSFEKKHEEYNITFDGAIDFILNNKEIFDRFNVGDTADVTYLEKYLSIYDDLDKDGTKEMVKRALLTPQFIDAQLRK